MTSRRGSALVRAALGAAMVVATGLGAAAGLLAGAQPARAEAAVGPPAGGPPIGGNPTGPPVTPAPPSVTGVTPSSGPPGGGTTVTITGTGFTGATAVSFGGTSAIAVTVASDSQITATSPAEAAGTVDVTVTGPGGASLKSSVDQFAYVGAPPIEITPNAPGTATVGIPYTASFVPSGGIAPYTWTASGLPAGLANTGSTITGTPTVAGDYEVAVTVTDANGESATLTFALTVNGSAPAVTTQPASQTVIAGQTVTFTAAATGTPTPTVQWLENSVPLAGQTSTTLTLTNVSPANSGVYEAVFTNPLGSATSDAATLNVVTGSAPAVTTQPASQTVIAGQTVTFTAAATGTPTPTVRWMQSTDGGATFSPLSDDATYSGATTTSLTIVGATAAQNGYEFEAVFTNSAAVAISNRATLTVSSPPVVLTTTSPLLSATAGTPYNANFAASQGTPPYEWSATGVPPGLSLDNSSGALTGTPAAAGNYTLVVTVTDQNGQTATATFALAVDSAPAVTTQPASQRVDAGATANFTAVATGNPPPSAQWSESTDGGTTWNPIFPGGGVSVTDAVSSGVVTTSLTLTGVTATQNGYQFEAVFTSPFGSATTTPAPLTVISPVSVGPASLPGDSGGVPYSQRLSASGGTGPPYTFSTTKGSLPPGLTLSSSGLLSGVPTAAGTFSFTVQATDANNNSGTASYELSVAPGLSLSLTGGVQYSDVGAITSGAVSVSPVGSGPIASITGKATLPGAHGGTATVNFNLHQVKLFGMSFYVGVVSLSDPSAGINVVTPTLTASVTRVGNAGASGQLQWVTASGRRLVPYTLHFETVGSG